MSAIKKSPPQSARTFTQQFAEMAKMRDSATPDTEAQLLARLDSTERELASVRGEFSRVAPFYMAASGHAIMKLIVAGPSISRASHEELIVKTMIEQIKPEIRAKNAHGDASTGEEADFRFVGGPLDGHQAVIKYAEGDRVTVEFNFDPLMHQQMQSKVSDSNLPYTFTDRLRGEITQRVVEFTPIRIGTNKHTGFAAYIAIAEGVFQ